MLKYKYNNSFCLAFFEIISFYVKFFAFALKTVKKKIVNKVTTLLTLFGLIFIFFL